MNLHTDEASSDLGIVVDTIDGCKASAEECAGLRRLIYKKKIVILRGQDMTPDQFVTFGRLIGEIEVYYQKMYHHPDHKEIFISSNVRQGDQQVGVPGTGAFWHSDYCFMPRPFGITIVYPQVVPKNRGTYFIDMTRAYTALPPELKTAIRGGRALHSPRRYFKIRPEDLYRPIGEVLDEVEKETPPVSHPITFMHPVNGERVLYVNAAATYQLNDIAGRPLAEDVLPALLESSGQLDSSFTHPGIHLQRFQKGDLLMWDNRSLVHRARLGGRPEPAASYRITVHDEHTFFGDEGADNETR